MLRGATLPLFFGIAVFTFEGIGLVIPVRHAMQEPEKFPGVLRRTMVALGALYVTFGMLSYLAFGDDTHDIITLNLPNNPLVAMVRLLYSTGLLFTFPIMLFPGAWRGASAGCAMRAID